MPAAYSLLAACPEIVELVPAVPDQGDHAFGQQACQSRASLRGSDKGAFWREGCPLATRNWRMASRGDLPCMALNAAEK